MEEQYNLTIRKIKEVYNPLNRFGAEKYTTQIGIVDRECPDDKETIIDDGISFLHSLVYRNSLGKLDAEYKLRFEYPIYMCELRSELIRFIELYTKGDCPSLEYHPTTETLYYDEMGFKFKLYNFGDYNISDFMLEMNPGWSIHPDRNLQYIVNYIMSNREKGYSITGLEGEIK